VVQKGEVMKKSFESNAGFADEAKGPRFCGSYHSLNHIGWREVIPARMLILMPKLTPLCLLFSIICFVPVAKAEWTGYTKGPDIFGNTTGIASAGGANGRLIVQCDKDELMIAYIMRKKEFEEVGTIPASLLVKIDSGDVSNLDGRYRNWNNNYSAIAVEDRSAGLIAIVKKIGQSKGTINIGAIINGHQLSDSFPASGSTAAIGKIVPACKL
jgi:hypothetical protein